MIQFERMEIEDHIRRNHPGCPDMGVQLFTDLVAKRSWKSVTMGGAVGIVMDAYLRHEMTDYNQLLFAGMERCAARRMVNHKIQKILESWKVPPPTSAESQACSPDDRT